jgi:hypothetical protein
LQYFPFELLSSDGNGKKRGMQDSEKDTVASSVGGASRRSAIKKKTNPKLLACSPCGASKATTLLGGPSQQVVKKCYGCLKTGDVTSVYHYHEFHKECAAGVLGNLRALRKVNPLAAARDQELMDTQPEVWRQKNNGIWKDDSKDDRKRKYRESTLEANAFEMGMRKKSKKDMVDKEKMTRDHYVIFLRPWYPHKTDDDLFAEWDTLRESQCDENDEDGSPSLCTIRYARIKIISIFNTP